MELACTYLLSSSLLASPGLILLPPAELLSSSTLRAARVILTLGFTMLKPATASFAVVAVTAGVLQLGDCQHFGLIDASSKALDWSFLLLSVTSRMDEYSHSGV